MLCYRDRTFCGFHLDCESGENCSRALTDKVKESAKVADLPISQFVNPPKHCFVKKEKSHGEKISNGLNKRTGRVSKRNKKIEDSSSS